MSDARGGEGRYCYGFTMDQNILSYACKHLIYSFGHDTAQTLLLDNFWYLLFFCHLCIIYFLRIRIYYWPTGRSTVEIGARHVGGIWDLYVSYFSNQDKIWNAVTRRYPRIFFPLSAHPFIIFPETTLCPRVCAVFLAARSMHAHAVKHVKADIQYDKLTRTTLGRPSRTSYSHATLFSFPALAWI